MKIGLVIDDSLDKADGVQQYVLTVGKWISSQGHEVHYLTSKTTRTDIANLHSLAPNVKLKFNQNWVGTPLPADKGRLRELLVREQFDVLHFQLPHSPLLSGRIIKLAPAKTAIVGTFHIYPFSKLQDSAAKILAKIIKKDWERFGEIISVSGPAKKFAKKCFGIDSVVIPNSIELKKYRSKSSDLRSQTLSSKLQALSSESSTKILYLGRLVKRKGARELLNAAAKLDKQTKNWQLDMAGTGPDRNKLEQLCERLNLSQVRFLGFVSENEKVRLLAGADIAIFPSLGGESFGIVLIEAMAAGSGVVIGGNNPGYASILGKWPECLINPKDPEGFAETLEKLIKDQAKRKKLHVLQQAEIKKYSIEVVGPQLLAVYNQAIAKNKTKKDNNY